LKRVEVAGKKEIRVMRHIEEKLGKKLKFSFRGIEFSSILFVIRISERKITL